MARYTKTGTPSTIGEVNAQFDLIATAINDTLSRVGDAPNQLEATLDANSNRLINLPLAISPQEPLRLQDLSLVAAPITDSSVVGSILAMKSTNFSIGNYVICKRYYADGELIDGLEFEIVAGSTGTDDGGSFHNLNNGTQAKLITTAAVSVKLFGAKGDNVNIDTPFIQAAIDYKLLIGGGEVFVPKGIYLVDATLLIYRNITISGVSFDLSVIKTNLDIEIIANAVTVSTALFNFRMNNIQLSCTVTTATTKYQVHLYNPNNCRFTAVRVTSGHVDTQYSETNRGGIWFEKPIGSTTTAFLNSLDKCWVQNNSVLWERLTDSSITGGFYWGHVREFAIKFVSCGACAIDGIDGLITSKFQGGIWINGANSNQLRITNNEFDGNPALDTGIGINCPQQAIACTISGNTVWGCDKHGILLTDPIGWTITGNNFWNNNALDTGFSDIVIIGNTIQPNGNTITGNTHTIDSARTTAGYAIKEVNSGNFPTLNSYIGNSIVGSYVLPVILLVAPLGQRSNSWGNTGKASQRQNNTGNIITTDNSLSIGIEGVVAAAGVLDLPINTVAGAGCSGIVNITVFQNTGTTISRKISYSLLSFGTTGQLTLIANLNGSGGTPSVTVTYVGQGILRVTNTGAADYTIGIYFAGMIADA
jgi:hypothetical protein